MELKDVEFNSQTYGVLSISEVVSCIIKDMQNYPRTKYSFIIGTDSSGHSTGGNVYFTTAIIIHRIGLGGIYFWHRITEKSTSFYERIFKEAMLSLEFTEAFLRELKKHDVGEYSFEIHVDVGRQGKTREIINEVIGMVSGNGYKVVTKPNGYGASKVADRHT